MRKTLIDFIDPTQGNSLIHSYKFRQNNRWEQTHRKNTQNVLHDVDIAVKESECC